MADNIGQILGEEPMVPNSPMMPGIGQALTQGQPQQPAMQPTPEMLADPKFHAIGEWIRKPENMMTALVLAGSLMQDRRPGQSKMDAVAERGLGALGFRGEMRRLNQKDTDEAAKAKSEIDYKRGQIDVATDRNRIEREGIEATSQDNLNRVTAQTGIAGMNDATARYLAELENASRLEAARISVGGNQNPAEDMFMSTKDIIDIQKIAADSGIPFEQAMTQFARVRAMTDPRFASMLTITEGMPTSTGKETGAPARVEKPTPKGGHRGRVGQRGLEDITTRPGKRDISVAQKPQQLGEYEQAKSWFRDVAKRDRRALLEAGSNPNLTRSQRMALEEVLRETAQSAK